MITSEEKGVVIYVVYENPSDYPGKYVAKRDIIKLGKLTRDPYWIMVEKDYAVIKKEMQRLGLVWMQRHMGDDPVIKETWI